MKCRNCKSVFTKHLFKKDTLSFFLCGECGLGFQDAKYKINEIQGLYSDNYYANLKRFSDITEIRYGVILGKLAHFSAGRRLLDVGCGCGHFLQAAGQRGWSATGVEVSKDIGAWVRKSLALDVRCGELFDLKLERDSFDVVTCFESIEHFSNPRDYLKEIGRILKENGILFLTTPNLNSLSKRIMGSHWKVFSKEHIFYFTPLTIRHMLEKCGFKVLEGVTKNFSVHDFKEFICRGKISTPTQREQLRKDLERSKVLLAAKASINALLDLFCLGDSIWIYARKIKEIN